LGLDYVFLAAYGFTLCLGCVQAAKGWQRTAPSLARIAAPVAWAQLVAAGCDAAENVLLWWVLQGVRGWAPLAAAMFAGIKVVLLVLGLAYCAGGAVSWLARRSR